MIIKYRIKRMLIKPIRLISRKKYQKAFCKVLRSSGVNLKEPWFISPDIFLDEVNLKLINIGENVVISKNVSILVHDHSVDKAMHCFEKNNRHCRLDRAVTIEDNCFIGFGCILLPGSHIGKNSIVGAGTVVKGVIPPNVVVAGNPLRIISDINDYYEKCKNQYNEYIHEY